MFDRLRNANLKLKLSKCDFLKTELSYLGHIISKQGIKPDPNKIKVLNSLSPPSDVRGVRSFIGMASYYRRFVDDFSEIAEPLINLTRKNVKFEWTDSCQQSFDILKHKLTTPPTLAYPDLIKPFVLYTDASDYCVGAVLVQEIDGIEKPIQYLSHKLTDTQRKWPVIDKEGYAIVYALQKLDHFLNGAAFVIKTDHKPLKYLFSSEMKNKKVQLWGIIISGYNCSIEYVQGKKNTKADMLSRLHHTNDYETDLPGHDINVINSDRINVTQEVNKIDDHDYDNLDIPTVDFDTATEQDKDTNLLKLKQSIIDKTANDSSLRTHVVLDNTLYYMTDKEANHYLRVVVPVHLQSIILKECHDGSSHLGIDKTFDRIKERYYWRDLYRSVVRYIAACVPCCTRNMKKNRVPMQSMDVPLYPFQKIGIDTCGPFTTSVNGNKYIVTVVDQYSGWPEAYPVPDKTAEQVAKIILDEIIPRYSCPVTLLSDNGTEYCNRLIDEISKVLKIHRITTTPYHPQSNGKTERFHRVLNDMLAKQMIKGRNLSTWDTYLPHILGAYRTSINETTTYSPHFLLYKCDPVLPIDTLLKPRRKYMGEAYHELALERQHVAYTLVRRHIKKSQKRQEDRHNKNVKPVTLKIGDPVYVHNSARTSKHDTRWEPYYRIIKQTGPVNFQIKSQLTGNVKSVHADQLKLAHLDEWPLPQLARPLRNTTLAVPADENDINLRDTKEIDKSESQTSSSSDSDDEKPLSELKRKWENNSDDNDSDSDEELPLSEYRRKWQSQMKDNIAQHTSHQLSPEEMALPSDSEDSDMDDGVENDSDNEMKVDYLYKHRKNNKGNNSKKLNNSGLNKISLINRMLNYLNE